MSESVSVIKIKLEEHIPFFFMLGRSGLYNDEELRQVISSVKKNEYVLLRKPKELESYNSAIRFHISMYHEFLRRYRATDTKKNIRREIHMLIKTILDLYKRGLKYFQDDWNFNMKYLEMLECNTFEPNYLEHACDHMMDMIQTFAYEPLIYTKAAGWFCSCKKYLDAGKALMLGQSRHPKNLHIYLDLFELEVSIYDQIPGTQKRLEKYVDQAIHHVDDYRFFFALTELVDQHERLRTVLIYLRDKMVSKFREEPEVWDYVAKREIVDEPERVAEMGITQHTVRAITHMVLRYKEGVNKVKEKAQKRQIWKLLLKAISKTTSQYCNLETIDIFKNVLIDVDEVGVSIEECHYVDYLVCCRNEHIFGAEMFAKAILIYPRSKMLWLSYLEHIAFDNRGNIEGTFTICIELLGDNSFKLFEFYENWLLLGFDTTKIHAFYRLAISVPYPEIVKVFKASYLDWVIHTEDTPFVRDLYYYLNKSPPYNKKMHQDMFIRQELQLRYEQSFIRKAEARTIRNKAISLWRTQFGHEDINVWLHEMYLHREIRVVTMLIYENAKRNLRPDKIEELTKIYNEKIIIKEKKNHVPLPECE